MKRNVFLWSVGIFWVGLAAAQADTWLQQRWQFKEAHQALLNNDLKTFKQLSTQLQNYPIAHYLRYIYLKNNLDQEDNQTIQTFLTQYQDSPIASSLRKAWLFQLANRQDWKTFLAVYTPPTNTELQCHYLQAHLDSHEASKDYKLPKKLLQTAKDLWRVGKSQPKACDPVFDYLYENEIISDSLRWQRIQLAWQKNNYQLAKFLAKGLPKVDQQWAARWEYMYRKPAIALKKFKYPDSSLPRQILLYGLRRLARDDVESAYNYWKEYQKTYALTKKDNRKLLYDLALRGVGQNHPNASHWLAEVDPSLVDKSINHAKLQVALLQPDWPTVIKLIRSLPAAEQDDFQWQYWLARSLEKTEQNRQAEPIFQDLSKNRHYYGFLASDRLGKPYQFHSAPLKISKAAKKQLLEKKIGLIRAQELYFVGLTTQARQEWEMVLPSLTTEELKVAAALAHQWGWHDRAIITIAKAKSYDDLKIRFPLPFYDAVLTHAQKQKIEFPWVYAVIRQESAFQTDARSVAGALGLMQLMPATANQVAAKQKIKLQDLQELFVPDININLGTAYLREMLNQFNNNHLLATVAYNAGPTRAKRWAKKYRCLPPDIWVELIPFTQTRDYVQRVLSYTPVFEAKMVGHQQVKSMPLDAIQTEGC